MGNAIKANSGLTPEQSDYFKDSMARSNKNGRLIVFYHGSNYSFNEFSTPLIWFSVSRSYASEYGRNLYKCYLDCHNWLDCGDTSKKLLSEEDSDIDLNFDDVLILGDDVDDLKPGAFDYLKEPPKHIPSVYLRNLAKRAGISDSELQELVESTVEQYSSRYDPQGLDLRIDALTRSEEFKHALEKRGFDSILAVESGHACVAVFSSKQAKLVDNLKPTSSARIDEGVSFPSIGEDIETHDELNPALFDGDVLKADVADALHNIVDEFVSGLKDDGVSISVKDIVLVGSNVSYNYTNESDLDVHVIVDESSIDCDENVMALLYGAYRSLFNKDYDIKVKGVPVEIYVEIGSTKANSNGIYSLSKGWVRNPVKGEMPEIDLKAFEEEFDKWEGRYKAVLGNPKTVSSQDAESLINDVYGLRKEGMASEDGEYSIGNLVFKEFRNRGYLDNLKELRNELKSKELSLEGLNGNAFNEKAAKFKEEAPMGNQIVTETKGKLEKGQALYKEIDGTHDGEVVSMDSNGEIVAKEGNPEEEEEMDESFEPISSFKTWAFSDKSKDGYKVVKTFKDEDGRLYVILNVGKSGVRPYAIGLGYNPDDGVWGQGVYDFPTADDAEEWLKYHYAVRPFKRKANEGIDDEIKGYLAWCKEKGLRPQEYSSLERYSKEVKPEKKECKEPKADKNLREGVSDSPYKDIIAEHFDYTVNFDFLDIVSNIIDRIDDIDEFKDEDEIYDAVYSALDDELIYDDDQWTVMRFYQTARDASLDEALDSLVADCVAIVEKIVEKGTDDSDEEENESLCKSSEGVEKHRYQIEYWPDEESREEGFGEIYLYYFDSLEDARKKAQSIVNDGYASSAEVQDFYGNVLWGYDGHSTWTESKH